MPDEAPTSVAEAVPAENLYVLPQPNHVEDPFRPRDKIRRRGVRALSNTELLSVILGESNRGRVAAFIRRVGFQNLAQQSVAELRHCHALYESQAHRLYAAFELHERLRESERSPRPRLVRPKDVAEAVSDIQRLRKEHLIGLYLDAQNGLIHRETLTIGSLNTTRTHPREILLPAIENVALGFILAHNHPSGSPDPSPEDIEFTHAVKRAGETIGIELYDHVIVADSGYVSLRERGDL